MVNGYERISLGHPVASVIEILAYNIKYVSVSVVRTMPFQKNEGNSRWNILYGQFRFSLERIAIVREGTEERTKSARFVVLCDIRLLYVRKRTARKNKYANEMHDSWPLSGKFLVSILRRFRFFAEEHGTSSTFHDKVSNIPIFQYTNSTVWNV